MVSSLQAFEEVIEFPTTEAYLNLGLAKLHNNNNNNNNNKLNRSVYGPGQDLGALGGQGSQNF